VQTSSDHIDTAVPDEQRSHSRGRESQGERDQQASVEAAMRLFPVAPISVVGETGLPAEEEPLPRGGAVMPAPVSRRAAEGTGRAQKRARSEGTVFGFGGGVLSRWSAYRRRSSTDHWS
jgi:hypothetical protein